MKHHNNPLDNRTFGAPLICQLTSQLRTWDEILRRNCFPRHMEYVYDKIIWCSKLLKFISFPFVLFV